MSISNHIAELRRLVNHCADLDYIADACDEMWAAEGCGPFRFVAGYFVYWTPEDRVNPDRNDVRRPVPDEYRLMSAYLTMWSAATAVRWTVEEAVEKIRPLYRTGIRGRNALHRKTGIPAGTVSKAIKILRETEPAKPLRSKRKTQSLSNLPNVELSRLVQEQSDDKEASPLDEDGANPRVETWHSDRSDY